MTAASREGPADPQLRDKVDFGIHRKGRPDFDSDPTQG